MPSRCGGPRCAAQLPARRSPRRLRWLTPRPGTRLLLARSMRSALRPTSCRRARLCYAQARVADAPLPSDSLRDLAADSSLASPPLVADDAAEDGPPGSHGIGEEFVLHCIDEHAAADFALHCVDGSLAELRRRLAGVARRGGYESVLALLEHGADVAHPERYVIHRLQADGHRVTGASETVCTVRPRGGATGVSPGIRVNRAPLLDQRRYGWRGRWNWSILLEF